jgi:hypothetical protein
LTGPRHLNKRSVETIHSVLSAAVPGGDGGGGGGNSLVVELPLNHLCVISSRAISGMLVEDVLKRF